ncbi:hypothetical protein QE152_g32530 [Popillia japonica]|uniref:Uncharacterized protein n=1 Tax=Popillia japonica TaxID=7064 RepID=A0AAW1IYN9_POPJA
MVVDVGNSGHRETNIKIICQCQYYDSTCQNAKSSVQGACSAKKQREVVRVTQVLTAAKLSPKTNNRNSNEVKKTPVPPVPNDVKITNRKNLFASKDKKKEISPKDLSGRG